MSQHTVAVIRTSQTDAVLTLFRDLGLTFVREQHGDGPVHWSAEANGAVLEIYPTRPQDTEGVRFIVQDPR